mmetsp:Transcript_2619/g.7688  ORF Transcript_2619/g.7688 Transcript_2619/m.7688 type:complete len:332 (-) Transcript_2619:410-1405(-)
MLTMTVDPDFAAPDPPPQGEASVALSDKTLLAVSLAGFIVLATTVYILIIRPNLSAEALEEGEGGGVNYDDELDNADVRTLNRAQRRARARNRMKKNRRIDPRAPGQLHHHHEGLDGEDDEHADGGDAAAAQQQLLDVDEVPPAAPDGNDLQQHLNRKERARLAKATEREERKLFEKERQEQRRKAEAAAAVERREREKERQALAQEEKRRREAEAHDRDLAEHREWMLMFADSQNDDSTVKDFICKAKLKKIWSVDGISHEYGVAPEEVEVRLRQLVADDRMFGIVSNGNFVHLEPDDMKAIAVFIKRNGRTSLPELSREICRVATGEQC